MLLSEIWIYPVKSLGGVRVEQAEVQAKGLKYDRRWMIVDEHGNFITQRTNPRMATIEVSFSPNGLLLSGNASFNNQILIPYLPEISLPIDVKVWNDELTAFTVSKKADEWLSDYLERKVMIVEMKPESHRAMNPDDAKLPTPLSFADDFPYHIISEASLEDLNSKLINPVTMQRFRPNLVISGAAAFGEDVWKKIRIGTVEFELIRGCERCVMVNIDSAGTKIPEPLKTLASYRRINKNIFFGQNAVCLEEGIINQKDIVDIINTKSPTEL